MDNNNYIEIIGFWGGVASILALVMMFFEVIRKVLAKIKENQIKQKIQYEKMRKGIKYITNKAMSFQEKQEVFNYVNSMLDYGRHMELRITIAAYFDH